jgi:excisionase family DNA binding protein
MNTRIPARRENALAHSIEDAARRTSCGRTLIYAAIKSGALKARKVGRRTVILDEDLRTWLASLPSMHESA